MIESRGLLNALHTQRDKHGGPGLVPVPFDQSAKENLVDSVSLIELLIGVAAVTVVAVFTLRDLITRYPIYPAPFLDGEDRDDIDAE